ncbi:MAG TPA: type II secretion system F family protein [Tepidisphaeraceae bacterium]|nr:type II secretion system F family protein [Tepidisphaeraceae bacterium]
MTEANTPTSQAFAYQAQTEQGHPMTGMIDAPDAQSAMQQLQMLRLRVTEIKPTASRPSAKAMRGDAFIAFNQQLAHLTKAGLPVERGLRLIADDIHSGKLARTINQLAAELEAGTPLAQAFEKYQDKFPSLYGRLIDAGVRSGNLAGVLFSLGRHMDTEQRLRATLWRALAYPLMVTIGLVLVMLFISIAVIPQIRSVYEGFHLMLPGVTVALLTVGRAMPYVSAVLLGLIVIAPIFWTLLRFAHQDRKAIELLVLPIPMVGPVLRFSLVARWLDAARIATEAGMDLPSAITLASDATGSPGITRDGQAMIDTINAGRPLSGAVTRVVPTTVPAAMEFAAGHHDLPTALATLSDMYVRQSDLRMQMIPTAVTPLTVILIALMVGFVVAGLFSPLLSLIQGITGH